MRARLLRLAAVLAIAALTALPGDSPFRIRAGRSRAVEDAVERLGSPRSEERHRAQNLLTSLGDRARRALLGALDSIEPEVRRRAGAALRAIERSRSDPSLRRFEEYRRIVLLALRLPDETRRGSVSRTALELDPGTAARAVAIVARSVEEDPVLHSRAVALLRDLGRPAGAPYMARLLWKGDFVPSVLFDAAEGLAAFGGPGQLDRVREAASGTIPAARRHALRALSRLGGERDVSLVLMSARDEDPRVREEAARALSRLGGPEAVKALLTLVGDPAPEIRRAAVAGLAVQSEAGGREAALLGLSDPSPLVRKEAIAALAGQGEPTDAAALRRLLHDREPLVRAAAVRALSALDSPDAAIRAGVRDDDPSVRREALNAAHLLPLAMRRRILIPLYRERDGYLLELRRSILFPSAVE